MTEGLAAFVGEIVGHLRRIEDAISNLASSWDSEPAKGSPAADERNVIPNDLRWGGDPMEMTHLFASLLMMGAHASMEPLRRVLAFPSMALAPYPVARSALESSARAWWVLELDIPSETRVARAMTEYLHGVREYEKAHNVVGNVEILKAIRERRDHLAEAASDAGFQVLTDDKGRPRALNQERPHATDLVARLLAPDLDGDFTYRFFTAMSHGIIAALHEATVPTAETRSGRVIATAAITNLDVVYLARAVSIGVCRAFDRRVTHCGWPTNDWSGTRDAVLDELKTAHARFRRPDGDDPE